MQKNDTKLHFLRDKINSLTNYTKKIYKSIIKISNKLILSIYNLFKFINLLIIQIFIVIFL